MADIAVILNKENKEFYPIPLFYAGLNDIDLPRVFLEHPLFENDLVCLPLLIGFNNENQLPHMVGAFAFSDEWLLIFDSLQKKAYFSDFKELNLSNKITCVIAFFNNNKIITKSIFYE